MLGGMLAPDRGQVWLEQTSLYEISPTARARLRGDAIGFVFQTFNLLGYLTAVEDVEVPLYLAGFSAAQVGRLEALLEVPEPLLYNWIVGADLPERPYDHDVMTLLRNFKLHPEPH